MQRNEIGEREWHEQDGFKEETGNGGGVGLFAQQSVDAKRDAQSEGDPGKTAVAKGQVQNAQRGEQDGDDLPARQFLAQKEGAEKNIHEGRHEIPEARFNDAVNVDRPDEKKPVDRNGRTAGQAKEEGARRPQVIVDLGDWIVSPVMRTAQMTEPYRGW